MAFNLASCSPCRNSVLKIFSVLKTKLIVEISSLFEILGLFLRRVAYHGKLNPVGTLL